MATTLGKPGIARSLRTTKPSGTVFGNDPTGNDSSQISNPMFVEKHTNTTALEKYSAAQFMVEQLH